VVAALVLFVIVPITLLSSGQAKQLKKANATLSSLSNAAINVYNQANDKQRFINEVHWHMSRFLTNDRVSEISLASDRVSTYLDTNGTYGTSWSITMKSNNLVAVKAKR
jgi:hypothetical protein